MPTTTLNEIVQTALTAVATPNWPIINNPFVKMYQALPVGGQDAVQDALNQANVQVVIVEPDETGLVITTIDEVALLHCLWPELTWAQQQRLAPAICSLCKKLRSLAPLYEPTFTERDLGIIFAGYNIADLGLPWRDVQQLLQRFNESQQRIRLQQYFQSYRFMGNNAAFVEQWRQFLTPLTNEDCYWVMSHLHTEQFKELVEELAFMFSFINDKHKVSLVQQLDNDYWVQYLRHHFDGQYYANKSLCLFLKLFASTDRGTIAQRFTPAQLTPFITRMVNLDHVLEALALEDRLAFLLHLGPTLLTSIYFYEDYGPLSGGTISCRINMIFQLLPEHQRLTFLQQGMTTADLALVNHDWSAIVCLVDNLPEPDILAFFNFLGPDVIRAHFNDKRPLYSTISYIEPSKQLSYIRFIQQAFPGLLNDPYALFSILDNLPKTDYTAFFALFSDTDLRVLCAQITYSDHHAAVNHYLQMLSTTTIISTGIDYPTQTLPGFYQPTPVPMINSVAVPMITTIKKTTVATDSPVNRPNPLTPLAILDAQLTKLALQTPMSGSDALFYQALDTLRQELHLQIDNQPLVFGRGLDCCPLRLTASATADFIDQWTQAIDPSIQLALINDYRDTTTPLTTAKTLSNTLAVVIVAALCVALGASIGFLIGSWAGPASALTASIGGMTGLLIASTLTGAAIVGSAGTIGAYNYFFRSPLQTAQQRVVEHATVMAENHNPSTSLFST
jgi:hypothetical protein